MFIVVGAGLAGLALALALAKLGYSVDLVERRHDVRKRNGATLSLQPNALKALQEICPEIVEKLKDKGIPIPFSGGNLHTWWTVRDALLEQVEKHPDKIKVWSGWAFSEVVDDASQPFVLAKFIRTEGSGDKNDGHCETMDIKGHVLVGTDGVHSTVREALKLAPPEYSGTAVWRGTITVPEDSPILTPLLSKGFNPIWTRCGPTAVAVFNHHEKHARVMCWVLSCKDPLALTKSHPIQVIEPYVDSPDDETLKIFQAIFELADPDDTGYADKLEIIEPPPQDGKGWGGKGRVTILGDAAHAMRPATGLGAALAFEDCAVLFRLLKERRMDAIKDASTIEKTILEFENTRLPRVRKIWHNEQKIADKMYLQSTLQLDPEGREFFDWIYNGI